VNSDYKPPKNIKDRETAASRHSWKYRKGLPALIHYLFWTGLLFLLWPVGLLFRLLEKSLSKHAHD
jgi:hypothetical protein